jgi:hypothetical protein
MHSAGGSGCNTYVGIDVDMAVDVYERHPSVLSPPLIGNLFMQAGSVTLWSGNLWGRAIFARLSQSRWVSETRLRTTAIQAI